MTTKTYDYYIDDLGIAEATSELRCKHFLWWMKELLRKSGATGAWSVVRSSDGSSVNTSDLWTSSFDDSKLIYADPGTAHSWMVLQSPGTIGGSNWYILLDYRYSGYEYKVDITFSNAAFSTGGTVTDAPTTAGNTHLNNYQLLGTYTGVGMCHGALAADGTFWMGYSRTASGGFSHLILMMTVDNLRTGDTNSVVVYAEGTSSLLATTPLDNFFVQLPDGTSITTTGTIVPYRYYNSAAALATTMGIDIVESKYPVWDVWAWYDDAGLGGQSIKGRIVDAFTPIGSLAQGTTKGGASIDGTVVGPLFLPADANPTL